MKRVTEDELIAYQMGELGMLDRARVRRALEKDAELAAEAEEIAATLRAFAADAAPVVSDAVVERSWERVRGGLLVLEPVKAAASGKRWFWAGTSVGAAAMAVVVVMFALHSMRVVTSPATPDGVTKNASVATASAKQWGQSLLDELHSVGLKRNARQQVNQRPGPLTTAPVDAVAEDPALAAHLDTAERVLTEVSHVDGPLPDETREQVHRLLLQNAVYRTSAEQHGDLATARVMDDLGRVLISLDAEPQQAVSRGKAADSDAFRLQMSIGGVLLDLRILHHNDAPRSTQ